MPTTPVRDLPTVPRQPEPSSHYHHRGSIRFPAKPDSHLKFDPPPGKPLHSGVCLQTHYCYSPVVSAGQVVALPNPDLLLPTFPVGGPCERRQINPSRRSPATLLVLFPRSIINYGTLTYTTTHCIVSGTMEHDTSWVFVQTLSTSRPTRVNTPPPSPFGSLSVTVHQGNFVSIQNACIHDRR